MTQTQQAFTVVIPARYGSSRLPGKPLRELVGKPMIEHVFQRATDSGAERVLVATDHDEIERVAKAFGAEVVRTSRDHASGTDRIAEVANTLGMDDETVVVNLQGDEPCMPPALVARVANRLASSPGVGIATLATAISESKDLFDPNVVKVVLDDHDNALYFSRAPIPWARDEFHLSQTPDRVPTAAPYLRHIGMYAYRVSDLKRIAAAPPARAEAAESLEQLRGLCMGIRIAVEVIDQAPSHGVDSEADVPRAEAELRTHWNTQASPTKR